MDELDTVLVVHVLSEIREIRVLHAVQGDGAREHPIRYG